MKAWINIMDKINTMLWGAFSKYASLIMPVAQNFPLFHKKPNKIPIIKPDTIHPPCIEVETLANFFEYVTHVEKLEKCFYKIQESVWNKLKSQCMQTKGSQWGYSQLKWKVV